MYVKLVKSDKFDVVGGYIGGFEDIPTKQDKFKPIIGKTVVIKNDDGTEEELSDVYVLNPKKKDSLKNFEEKFKEIVVKQKTKDHPYAKSIPLEIIMNIKMSSKRYQDVDVDNIAKCILDIMKGELFEDDSQVQSLFVFKQVMPAIPLDKKLQEHTGSKKIPEGMSGIIFGIRKLDDKSSLLANQEFYDFEEISEEEYVESKKEMKEQSR